MASTQYLLKKSVIEEVLRYEENCKGCFDPVSIINYNEETMSNAGYLSLITRVRVVYTVGLSSEILTRSFIFKTPLGNEAFNGKVVVENELWMYNEVIPKIMEVAHIYMAPRQYPCSLPDWIVMEDLTASGYTMCNSATRLDFKHTKAVLMTLAKFHSATVALKHKYPGFIENKGKEWYFSNEPKICNHFKPKMMMRLYGLARVLQETRGYERYGNVLLDAGEAFWDLMVELYKPNGKLNVLIHGDFWTNNLMFKYNSAGCVIDVKFVDYQMRRFCSPAIDLLQLFWTSVDDAARLRMYELLEMYRHTLNSSLSELGCPERLTRQELKEEVSKRSAVILLICLFLPLTMPDEESTIDVNNLVDSEEILESTDFNINPLLAPFKQQNYRAVLPEICKELKIMKIFQILVKNKNRI